MDCDGHVLEPQEIWTEYVEPEFRSAVRSGMWKEDYPEGGWRVDLNGKVHSDKRGSIAFFGAIMRPGLNKDELASITMNSPGYPIAEGAFDPVARLGHMDLMGIDQVMLLPTFCGMTFTCIEDPKAALGLARAYNGWIHDFCEPDRSRLFPAGIIPQHDNDDAIAEVQRIAGLGFRCVIIRPNIVAGRYPAHPSFDPVWQAISDCGLVAGVHPFVATPRHRPRTARPGSSIGHRRRPGCAPGSCPRRCASPTTLRPSSCSRSTRTCGPSSRACDSPSWSRTRPWLPYLLEKADGRVRVWTATRAHQRRRACPRRPSTSAAGSVSNPTRARSSRPGARYEDIGIWASDYPHFDAEDAWEGIEHMERWGVPREVQAKLLGANACRMYGIEPRLVVTDRLPLAEPAARA